MFQHRFGDPLYYKDGIIGILFDKTSDGDVLYFTIVKDFWAAYIDSC